jgi:hypothetical protein
LAKKERKMLKTIERIKVVCSINNIIKDENHIKRRRAIAKSIINIVLFTVCSMLCYSILSSATVFFESLIPANNEWAVAMIAIPIAFIGIYVSILIAVTEKYNRVLCDRQLQEYYFSASYWFDFSRVIFLRFWLNLIVWFFAYLTQDYAKIIAYSFVLTFDLVYLVIFNLWKYKLPISRLISDAIIKQYIPYNFKKKKTGEFFNNGNSNETSMQTIYRFVKESNYIFFNHTGKLMFEIVCDAGTKEELIAWSTILIRLNKRKRKLCNVLLNLVILNNSMGVIDYCFKKKDYVFVTTLMIQASNLWRKTVCDCFINESNFYKKFAHFSSNSDHITACEARSICQKVESFKQMQRKTKDCLTDLYQQQLRWKNEIENNELLFMFSASNATWDEVLANNAEVYDKFLAEKSK